MRREYNPLQQQRLLQQTQKLQSPLSFPKNIQLPQPPIEELSILSREAEIELLSIKARNAIRNGRKINEPAKVDEPLLLKGETLLIRATKDRRYEIIEALLRLEEVDVNAVDDRNNNALHHATSIGDKKIIKLLASRADLEIDAFGGSNKFTALQIATIFGFDEVVQALIDEKASVNICNSNTRNSALHLATTFGKEKVVKLLLKNDADLNMVNNEGKTALDIANTIEDKAKRATIIKLLTAQKVNLKDGEDKAITTGEKTRKRKCVRKAPDNLNQHHANNLRFFALECNFLKVKELLEKGANPNWVAKKGDHSPIMLAVLSPKKDDYEKIEIIALLYKYGAKIDLESFDAIFKNKVISADLCENIRKLNANDPKEFSVEEFLESLPKPGGGLGSNPRKRPSSDVQPINNEPLVTKMSRSEGLG